MWRGVMAAVAAVCVLGSCAHRYRGCTLVLEHVPDQGNVCMSLHQCPDTPKDNEKCMSEEQFEMRLREHTSTLDI